VIDEPPGVVRARLRDLVPDYGREHTKPNPQTAKQPQS
jgi:hypothetical protein